MVVGVPMAIVVWVPTKVSAASNIPLPLSLYKLIEAKWVLPELCRYPSVPELCRYPQRTVIQS